MNMTNSAAVVYEQWLNDPLIDDETKAELKSIADQPAEIEDRFFRELTFGTGGLRGVIGAGTNRMNRYIIGKATQGLAQYVLKKKAGSGTPSVVIAHDSRRCSPEFALEAALVLAGNGIKAYLFEDLRPTPELSFAVRHLGADAGIVITASHNPPEYNGYKVYNQHGGQLVPSEANEVIEEISKLSSFAEIRRMTREEAERQGLLVWIGEEVDAAYIDEVVSVSRRPEAIRAVGDELKIIYTPLHGTGHQPVVRALQKAGFTNVRVVEEQATPDGNFPTVKSPNPEEREAFTLALEIAKQQGADLVIGTDPDADRMGAVVMNSEGEYVILTGNQSGAIMVDYLLGSMKENGDLPQNGAVIKTIVTSEMGAKIAESYGAKVLNTLTGFKYIGELMTKFEQTGEHTFLFGYEESYGYLAGNYARDKDAVVAALLIAEAAAYYKTQGKTLYEVLLELYERYGYYQEHLESRTMKGKDGLERIGRVMEEFRRTPPQTVAGVNVVEVKDYLPGIDGLPPENVLKFFLEDGSWFCLRPSGTEPKIKVYFAVRGTSLADAKERLEKLVREVMARVDE
ncbi:phosphomannomutase [Insulibacter thermoxylanivorax]|uniref:Phosphoglucomutase n=1 Tax=Insulibacter thermoxylanivorax TaxID=2749268 RepID=A0A916QEQ7_9BACL|nr:phosphomannomutase [Insulibacter thermoxylanivorax]